MKKAKVMLLAIAVLATVGGALAFKATNFGFDKYCYLETTIQPAAGECEAGIQAEFVRTVVPIVEYYYTTTNDETKCHLDNDLLCTSTAEFTID